VIKVTTNGGLTASFHNNGINKLIVNRFLYCQLILLHRLRKLSFGMSKRSNNHQRQKGLH
jgi:hypothetical protein